MAWQTKEGTSFLIRIRSIHMVSCKLSIVHQKVCLRLFAPFSLSELVSKRAALSCRICTIIPGSQFRLRPFFSFFVRIPRFCGRGPIHKSPKFELKDIFLTTLSSWPLLLSWCEKCGRYLGSICGSAGTDVIRLKVFSFRQNLKPNSPKKNCQKVNKLKCFKLFRGGSRMEEWQLGPPLLVGDRVVHLGEVVRIIIIVLMPTDWCGKATNNVRGAPHFRFSEEVGNCPIP